MSDAATILYAEDDENDVFFMQRAFARAKRRETLRIVTNGSKAVDYLWGDGGSIDREKNPLPAVIFLDVKMPEMSGLEVLSWIRARREFDALPVVMFTSSTQESDVEFCRAHGANAYVVKPSNADNLAKLVENVLAACSAASPQSPRLAVQGNLV